MTLLLLLPETGPQTTPPPPSDTALRTLLGVGLTLAFGFIICLL